VNVAYERLPFLPNPKTRARLKPALQLKIRKLYKLSKKGSLKGRSPKYITGSLRGTKSLLRKNLPLPLVKGKGIQGMGF
jgi:hypothetical protein